MKLSDFDYNLPPGLIAQTPLQARHNSKLFVIDKNGKFIHDTFINITDYLSSNDVLVMNDSKVFNARFFARKVKTGGKFEFLLLQELDKKEKLWKALTNPGRRVHIGDRFIIKEGVLECEILDRIDEGVRIVKLFYEGDLIKILDDYGQVPTPPYIKIKDVETRLIASLQYQTLYAKKYGSIAAPTAGFHLTEEVFNKLRDNNISAYFITLHVGIGTWRPVKADNIEEHIMSPEYFEISRKVLEGINAARADGKKIVAVGTTAARALESSAGVSGKLEKTEGWTDLFIYPGYVFKCVDSLITNFHLPKSTLLMLVSAFRGKDIIKNAYEEAIRKKYRFYSFGDVMFVR